jgi:CheY-like chemotaxis protein
MAKILVIDDDPAMRRVTSRALEAAGHVVAGHAMAAAPCGKLRKTRPTC